MSRVSAFTLLLSVAAASGCSVVERAHEAQRATEEKGMCTALPSDGAKVDLRAHTLSDLVSFAMTNRPSVVSARLAVEDARLALKAVAAEAPVLSDTPWTAPKLSLGGSYSESSAGTTYNGGNWRTSGDPSVALSLELLLWDFGRHGAQAKARAEEVVAAEQALAEEGFSVFGEVSAGYFSFHENRAQLLVALTNQQQYAEHLALAEARHEAGEGDRLDVLKARLDLANARQETVSASNLVETSGARLMYVLGVDAVRGTWLDAFGASPETMEGVLRAFPRTTGTAEESFAFARTNAPAICVKRARLRAASHDVDYAVADLYPKISASASLNWMDPLWFWSWGVNAVQSVFQGFSKVTAVDRAVVGMKTAAASVDAAEQALSAEIETAVATRDNSVHALKTARASLVSARENLDLVTAQYALGEAGRIELSDAIAAHSQAIGDAITAFYAGQRAEAALFALLGRYPAYDEGKEKILQ